MTHDAPKYETIERIDIGAIKDGDEVFKVRLECGAPFEGGICGRLIEAVPLETAYGSLTAYSWDRCRKCLQYSGFQYDKNSADAPKELRQLCDLLRAENLRYPAKETRRAIQRLLEGRKLTLLFTVKRLSAT